MTTFSNLTRNTKVYLIADFFWNIGRTLPHAILTIYLLSIGITLSQIAILQMAYMIIVIVFEFPSGILCDYFSRKKIYIISLVLILISYLVIGLSKQSFLLILFAYCLYGLSSAFKSGSIENDVVLELRALKADLKTFSVISSYVSTISSIIGAFIGSILYQYMNNNVYIIAIFLFFISIFIILFFRDKLSCQDVHFNALNTNDIFSDIKLGCKLFFNNEILRKIIILFSITSFFIQPLFQYWQVLYEIKNIPIYYFGYVYIIFQVCNIVGSYLYKKISNNIRVYRFTLVFIMILSCISCLFFEKIVFFVTFPLIIILFYIYCQYLDVILKEKSPAEYISTYSSLVSAILNVTSVITLFIMSIIIKLIGVIYAYTILFSLFSIISLLFISIKKQSS